MKHSTELGARGLVRTEVFILKMIRNATFMWSVKTSLCYRYSDST